MKWFIGCRNGKKWNVVRKSRKEWNGMGRNGIE